jgi:CHASE3 domain sensor protein
VGGLAHRMIVACGLLALVAGAAFAILLVSITDLHRAEQHARLSEEALVSSNRLERLIVDAETGQRGFLLTRQEEFLQPWQAARSGFAEQAAALERLVADNPEQHSRAQRISEAGTSYILDYSLPQVDAARRDPVAAQTVTAIDEGKRRLDAIRAEFDSFVATEDDLAAVRQSRSDAATNRATLAAAGGIAGSVILVVLFANYLNGAIVRPVRLVAATAGRLADGDLGARLPERGIGEIGVLERSFNRMAGSLENSRDQLAASRARIVAAADQARRRIERDLHDGTQQQLVSLALDLRTAEATLPPELAELRAQLADAATKLAGATDDLREISRGIHPAVLSEGGLAPALKALARR